MDFAKMFKKDLTLPLGKGIKWGRINLHRDAERRDFMTIKDVEKQTGLTAKSIRYYEEKGLIRIERNAENDYREFTQEDIQRLKRIKILRYLEFRIDEIAAALKADDLSAALEEKLKYLVKESNTNLEKQAICRSLLEDCKKKDFTSVQDDYSNTIHFLESEDGKDFVPTLLDALCPNMSAMIVQSLICLGPILWLFLNIYLKKWSVMLTNSVLALFCAGFLAVEWVHYFDYREKHRELVKEKNRKNSFTIPVMVISLIGVIALFVLFSVGVEHMLAPEDYLFFETPEMIAKVMIYSVVILCITFSTFILKKLKVNRTENLDGYLELWDKFKYILLILFAIITYCFITSTTFVTKDQIIYRDPFHPFGVSYAYSDVTRIETGFGSKRFSFLEYERKGQFYYRIYVDNREITFHTPSPNEEIERYAYDSYLELEDFDSQLMKYEIEKISDDEYASACDYDKRYVDRFLRIIHNR